MLPMPTIIYGFASTFDAGERMHLTRLKRQHARLLSLGSNRCLSCDSCRQKAPVLPAAPGSEVRNAARVPRA